jgi:hypothetical protein
VNNYYQRTKLKLKKIDDLETQRALNSERKRKELEDEMERTKEEADRRYQKIVQDLAKSRLEKEMKWRLKEELIEKRRMMANDEREQKK